MYFLIEDDDLKKYNNICDKVSADIKKEFARELVYNKFFLKTKIKSHSDEVTGFYNKDIPKADSNHTCLTEISLDSALKKDENYYPQVFLKECKYSEKKVVRHIIDDLESSSSNFDDSDEEKIKDMKLIVCSYHVTYAFQCESTLCSCLNVTELHCLKKKHNI